MDREGLLRLHEESLVAFGGAPGLRDEGLLESALARPQQPFAYGEPDLASLAAAYAFGIAKNHAFVDPRAGENAYRLTQLKRGEPDAALFKLPADYEVRSRVEDRKRERELREKK